MSLQNIAFSKSLVYADVEMSLTILTSPKLKRRLIF